MDASRPPPAEERVAARGVPIAVHNRTTARTKEFMDLYSGEGAFTAAESTEDFVAALEKPRRIIVMVKAGKPVAVPQGITVPEGFDPLEGEKS